MQLGNQFMYYGPYRPQANWGGQLLLMNWGRKSHFKRIGPRESVVAHPCTCKSLLLQAASVFRGHVCRPYRAEGTLYVQSTCMDVQGRLCTVTPKCRPCTRLSARAGSTLSRAESTLYVQSTRLDVQRILCTFKLSRHSIY